MGFAITCSLARHRRPHHPILVHRPVSLLHASFRPHLAVTPLRFATLHLHQVGTGLSPASCRTCLIRAWRPAKLYENHSESSKNAKGLERRGRPCIGKVEAVNMSDPERACLSE